MKNMKIKSYTFKKNSVLNKEQNSKIHDSAINEVEKIIKSPSLNISSKFDDKGSICLNKAIE
jgi:hypothetical protein